jgi:SAM-dependent methyltransferase
MKSLFKRQKITVSPYAALSEIYDTVMSHVNYREWAQYIDRLIDHVGLEIRSIVDISCGTGSLAFELERLRYDVQGCDYSSEMVLKALLKARQRKSDVPFWTADMCYTSWCQPIQAVVCLYDSMNYLLQERLWKNCLSQIYSSLPRNGLFIFDVSTISNSQYYFNDYVQRERTDDMSYVRKSIFHRNNKIQENVFEIQLVSHPGIVFYEQHRQQIHDLQTLQRWIDNSYFRVIGLYEGFTFSPGTEKSERVHFVLLKE